MSRKSNNQNWGKIAKYHEKIRESEFKKKTREFSPNFSKFKPGDFLDNNSYFLGASSEWSSNLLLEDEAISSFPSNQQMYSYLAKINEKTKHFFDSNDLHVGELLLEIILRELQLANPVWKSLCVVSKHLHLLMRSNIKKFYIRNLKVNLRYIKLYSLSNNMIGETKRCKICLISHVNIEKCAQLIRLKNNDIVPQELLSDILVKVLHNLNIGLVKQRKVNECGFRPIWQFVKVKNIQRKTGVYRSPSENMWSSLYPSSLINREPVMYLTIHMQLRLCIPFSNNFMATKKISEFTILPRHFHELQYDQGAIVFHPMIDGYSYSYAI